ncbi:hypothetical protein SPHINGOT1_470047 [Sphingomonas sp. T1]|nr:hypothetical protein SPHINGOT1_470047 [Sphingomonas sp. T1]
MTDPGFQPGPLVRDRFASHVSDRLGTARGALLYRIPALPKKTDNEEPEPPRQSLGFAHPMRRPRL